MQVSIIIPTYNSEGFLRRAFASAITQSGVEFEIIIVDNNSTDGTVEVAKQLCQDYPQQIRFAREKIQGAAAARNTGVRMATGEWIQFLDSDDVLLPGKIERQLGLAKKGKDWVIGAYFHESQTGKRTVSMVNEQDPWKGLVHNGGVGNTNSNLIRRAKYLAVGGQNEELVSGEDTDLYFRLLKASSRVAYDNLPGSVYIDRQGYRLSQVKEKDARMRPVAQKQRVIDYLRMEMPNYYERNGGFFRSALLNEIRILATENFHEAKQALSQHFPDGVDLDKLDLEITSPIVKLYPIAGFTLVERCRVLLGRLLPNRLRKLIRET